MRKIIIFVTFRLNKKKKECTCQAEANASPVKDTLPFTENKGSLLIILQPPSTMTRQEPLHLYD